MKTTSQSHHNYPANYPYKEEAMLHRWLKETNMCLAKGLYDSFTIDGYKLKWDNKWDKHVTQGKQFWLCG